MGCIPPESALSIWLSNAAISVALTVGEAGAVISNASYYALLRIKWLIIN